MTLDDTLGEIRGLVDLLPGVFANLRACRPRGTNSICWPDYARYWMPTDASFRDFGLLAETGQYSLQMADDGALVQFYYDFHRGRDLRAASLCFIQARKELMPGAGRDDAQPTSGSAPSRDHPSQNELGDNDVEADEGDTSQEYSVSWFRIDYDPDAAAGGRHPPCHLHWSGFPNARLPLAQIPTPAQFVGLILQSAYPERINEYITAYGAVERFPQSRYPSAHFPYIESIPHVRIPHRDYGRPTRP